MPLVDSNGQPVALADLPSITIRPEDGDGYEAWLPMSHRVCGRGNTRHQAHQDLERSIREWIEANDDDDFVVESLPMERRPRLGAVIERPAEADSPEPSPAATPGEDLPSSWPVCIVIDGRWLFATVAAATFGPLMEVARAKADGLAVEWRPESPELLEQLQPWSDRPDGVGLRQDPATRARLHAIARGPGRPTPPAAGASAVPAAPNRATAPQQVQGVTNVFGPLGWEARCPQLEGQVFRGGTPAEARLRLEAAVQRAQRDEGQP